MRRIDSDAVNSGRNADLAASDDTRYVRCRRCGFICHLDRDIRGQRGSKQGNGVRISTIATPR